MMTRSHDLLEAAARAFGDGRDPFSTDFLVDHNVTADECMALSNQLEVLILGFLHATPATQNIISLIGATVAEGVPLEPGFLEGIIRAEAARKTMSER